MHDIHSLSAEQGDWHCTKQQPGHDCVTLVLACVVCVVCGCMFYAVNCSHGSSGFTRGLVLRKRWCW